MSQESTTPDLVELVRALFDAVSRRDFDAAISVYAPDAILRLTAMGTSVEGLAAIRGFLEDFVGTFSEYEVELEEILDLGSGVTFGVFLQQGRPVGSSGRLQMRAASVGLWTDGLLARHTLDPEIDQARAAAERLAESRE